MPCTGSTSTSGILRAARRKFSSISAPSMISALVRPSLPNEVSNALVLAVSTAALSSTTMPPSLALAESACRKASARTFLGSSMAWLRTSGPNERPPPRNRFARPEPWRALPVPFCRYIFLPVRLISDRFFTLWVPRWRRESCQRTQRWIRSVRGSSPKMASESSTEPAAAPSMVVTLSSMSRSLRGRCFGAAVRRRRRLAARQAELAGPGNGLRQSLLHRIAYSDPAALGARHGALHQDEAALNVGLHHLEIERGDALDTHMAGHLLALEGLTRIL